MDTEDLNRLESLLVSATPAPWTLSDFGGPVVCDCAADEKWDGSGLVVPVSAANPDVPLRPADDAMLIVALRNQAAELIRLARKGIQ